LVFHQNSDFIPGRNCGLGSEFGAGKRSGGVGDLRGVGEAVPSGYGYSKVSGESVSGSCSVDDVNAIGRQAGDFSFGGNDERTSIANFHHSRPGSAFNEHGRDLPVDSFFKRLHAGYLFGFEGVWRDDVHCEKLIRETSGDGAWVEYDLAAVSPGQIHRCANRLERYLKLEHYNISQLEQLSAWKYVVRGEREIRASGDYDRVLPETVDHYHRRPRGRFGRSLHVVTIDPVVDQDVSEFVPERIVADAPEHDAIGSGAGGCYGLIGALAPRRRCETLACYGLAGRGHLRHAHDHVHIDRSDNEDRWLLRHVQPFM
jgi:hypothetical protein